MLLFDCDFLNLMHHNHRGLVVQKNKVVDKLVPTFTWLNKVGCWLLMLPWFYI